MNQKTEHTDLFGREIKPDDYIVYSATDGQSSTLRAGQVISLKTVTDYYGKTTAKVYCKSWSNFKSDGWNGQERSGRQKNVTLGFLTRVVVVDASAVSDKIKSDLCGPICDWKGDPI